MAKSIRSKSKRKFRAVKRTKSLKKMKDELQNIANLDVKLVTLPFVTRNELLTASRQEPPAASDLADQGQKDQAEPMETSKAVSIRNQHGNYPVWMNKRERKRQIRLYRMKKRSKRR